MSNFAGASRTVVIRTSRETLGLVAAASAMTFAMAYAVHAKHDRAPRPAVETRLPAPQQDWAGHLAEVAPTNAATPSEPMSSAALVVPKSQLALPTLPAKLAAKRPCPDASCARTPATTGPVAAAPSKHTVVAADRTPEKSKRTTLGMLNPLNHLPDMATVSRPFTYAGSTVAGWFKRL